MGRYAVSGNEAQILCKASPMDRKRVGIVKESNFPRRQHQPQQRTPLVFILVDGIK
jgi:hypothetical protein